jgi:hypothetical protein
MNTTKKQRRATSDILKLYYCTQRPWPHAWCGIITGSTKPSQPNRKTMPYAHHNSCAILRKEASHKLYSMPRTSFPHFLSPKATAKAARAKLQTKRAQHEHPQRDRSKFAVTHHAVAHNVPTSDILKLYFALSGRSLMQGVVSSQVAHNPDNQHNNPGQM